MMGERKETSGFLTLEEMRDELRRQTGNRKEEGGLPTAETKEPVWREVASETLPFSAGRSGLPEEKNVFLETDAPQTGMNSGYDDRGKPESKELSSDLQDAGKGSLGQEDEQPFTEEEKKRRSQEKLQEFLKEGSRNIYSHSKSERGPSIFQTGAFSNQHRMTLDDAQAFREMKISDTMVNQYHRFRAQRVKKAADFQLRREEQYQTRRVRPLYAEVPEEQSRGADEVEIEPQDNESLCELEYRSPKDRTAVADYLRKLQRTFTIVTVGLSILMAVAVVWISILMFAPARLPVALIPERATTYLTGWLILLGLAAAFSWDTLRNGLKGLFTFKANCDSPVSLAAVGSLLQLLLFYASGSRLTADGNVFLLAPVAIECLLIHSVGRLFLAHRATAQFQFLCRTKKKTYASGILANEELAAAFTRGRIRHRPFVGFARRADFPSDFMYYTFLEDQSDQVGYFVAPISLCLAFLVFAVSTVCTDDIFIGLTLFAAILSVSGSSTFLVGLQAPLFLVQRRLRKYDASLLGYEAASEFGELNAAMISAQKLFPKGTVRLCGMRTFHRHPIDDSILCAASILNASNSILRDMFLDILLGRLDILKPVDSVLLEDNLGISGWVDDRHVIIGSREMAINHNIPVLSLKEERKLRPEGTELVYISISGELAAAFIFSLSAAEETEKTLIELLDNDIVVVVQTVDPVVTAEKLSDLFGIDEELFKILPARFHKAYRKQVESVEKTNSPVLNDGSFASFAASLIGAKRLKKTVLFTTVLSLAGAAVGILLLLLLTATQQLVLFSAPQILLLQGAILLLIMILCAARRT